MTLVSAYKDAQYFLAMDKERNVAYRPVIIYRSIHGGYATIRVNEWWEAGICLSRVVAFVDAK